MCGGEQREEGRLCLSLSKEDNEVSGAEPTPAWQIPERTCCPGLALRTALTHITELATSFFFSCLPLTVLVSRVLGTNRERLGRGSRVKGGHVYGGRESWKIIKYLGVIIGTAQRRSTALNILSQQIRPYF